MNIEGEYRHYLFNNENSRDLLDSIDTIRHSIDFSGWNHLNQETTEDYIDSTAGPDYGYMDIFYNTIDRFEFERSEDVDSEMYDILYDIFLNFIWSI